MGDASTDTTPRLVVSNYGTRIAVADSHISGKTTALDITIGGSGVIAHVTEEEALRLAAALLSSIARNRRSRRGES